MVPHLPRLVLAAVVGGAAPAQAGSFYQVAAPTEGPATAVTVYLAAGGAALTAGVDDSAAGTASLLWSLGVDSLTVPAYRGSAAGFRRMADCVATGFAPFRVDVVTERPASGDYVMVVVGGRPSLVGYGEGVSGVAPYSGGVLPRAVALVFAAQLGNDPDLVCQSALHEVGHTLGLDHVYHCPDVMSYLHGCGEKSFTRFDAPCGELAARTCGDGEETQSSYDRLARAVGLRDEAGADDAPPDAVGGGSGGDDGATGGSGWDDGSGGTDDADNSGWDDGSGGTDDADSGSGWDDGSGGPDDATSGSGWEGGWDDGDGDGDSDGAEANPSPGPESAGPWVAVISPDDGARPIGDDYLQIAIRAGGDRPLADVELAWVTPDRAYLFGCGAMPDDAAATCDRDGDLYVFTLRVGTGPRGFLARATDEDGRQALSDPAVLWLE